MERLSSSKSVHSSIRLSLDVRNELKDEARIRNINLNSLINQILIKHVSFDRIADHVRVVPLNLGVFHVLLDTATEDSLERVGKEMGPKIVKRTFDFLGYDYNVDSLVLNYFEPLSSFSGWYTFKSVGKGTGRKLLFEQPHGRKWSIFLRFYIAGILREATRVEPKITIEDDLVTVFLS